MTHFGFSAILRHPGQAFLPSCIDEHSLQSIPQGAISAKLSSVLNIEQEVHYITVLHNILLALYRYLPGFARCFFAAKRNIIIIFYDLGAYKTPFEVAVDNTCRLRSFNTPGKCPGSFFVSPGCRVGL